MKRILFLLMILPHLLFTQTLSLQSILDHHAKAMGGIENWKAFKREYVNGADVVGISAGASTPPWVIEEFISNLEAL